MATRKEIKELRKPDEFIVLAARAGAWVEKNWKAVAGGIAAVVALVAIFGGLRSMQSAKEEKSSAALGGALEIAGRPVVESKDEKKDETKEYFPSDEAKRAAVFEAFEKVRKDFAGSAAALTATLKLAEAKAAAKDGAAAVALFSEYLSQAPSNSPLLPFALEGLGYAYEAQGKLDEAQAAFDRLGSEAGDPGRAAYHRARLLQVRGKLADARAAFEQVGKDYEKDEIGGEAWTRAELLAAPEPSPK